MLGVCTHLHYRSVPGSLRPGNSTGSPEDDHVGSQFLGLCDLATAQGHVRTSTPQEMFQLRNTTNVIIIPVIYREPVWPSGQTVGW